MSAEFESATTESTESDIYPIPTYVITGFLGSGKTTLIQHLLKQKPEQERWAVLVNEFGEIGIDGQLLGDQQSVHIREVPGGCMCCTSGLPMQIALSQLISRAKPHKLFIEPTGLGHPKEVLAELKAPHNQPYIDIQASVTLVDARKLVIPKYHTHEIYRQQLDTASLLVANKADLYQDSDVPQMQATLAELGLSQTPLKVVANGELDLRDLLDNVLPSVDLPEVTPVEHAHAHEHASQWQRDLAEQGHAYTQNAKDGFSTRGWIFNDHYVFDYQSIFDLLTELEVERVKAVFITQRGIFGFNKVDDVLTAMELDETTDSRLELIVACLALEQAENREAAALIEELSERLQQAVHTQLA